MSVCGPSGHTEEDSGSEEVTASGAAVRDIYKQKPASKVVRVLTVVAYLLSVSLAAILLSVYYVCVWKSPDLPALNGTGDMDVLSPSAHKDTHYDGQQHNYTGRSDSSVESLVGDVATESSENTTSIGSPETRTEGGGGDNNTFYDATTVDYTDSPVLNNDTDPGT